MNLLRRSAVIVLAVMATACGLMHGAPAPVTIKIIAFNDFHGSLTADSYAAIPGRPAVLAGGMDYLAAYVAQMEGENPNHVVVSAGDLVGASPLISAFHHDEATIEAMNLLGLDISAVGNHEFDAGAGELRRKQDGGCFAEHVHTCLRDGSFTGATFRYLAANVIDTASGRTIFPPYAIRTFQGARIAFIGVGLRSTPRILTPRAAQGLAFEDEAASVNALIPSLRAQGVRAIVVLIHQGGVQSAGGPADGGINECAGLLGGKAQSPIVDVVARLSDEVDLVITGHTHKAYNCRLPNAAGRLVPVTQAGYYGRVVSNIDLTPGDRPGRGAQVTVKNVVVSHPAADAPDSPVHPYLSDARVQQMRALVADYAAAAAVLANQVLGTTTAPLTSVALPSGEEPAGDLVVDSELAATSPPSMGGAVMAFVNQGGVRPPGFDTAGATYPHDITYQEAFAVRPFGDTLVTMTLTAKDIKDLLEQQFAGCDGQTVDKILQVSNGLHVDWSASPSAAPCSRIVNVSLRSPTDANAVDSIVSRGEVPHPAQTYRVTVDNYLAAGGDGLTVFERGTEPLVGVQDIDALTGYLTAHYRAPDPPYDPSAKGLHVPRRVRLP